MVRGQSGEAEGDAHPEQVVSPLLARLESAYGVQLSVDVADGSSSHALERRRLALERCRESAPDPALALSAPVRQSRGRPSKLSELEEMRIAIFIAERQLAKRFVKNAVADACDKFDLSRATIFRIWNKHGDRARRIASTVVQMRKRKFRRVVETKYRLSPPDFSGWGADDY